MDTTPHVTPFLAALVVLGGAGAVGWLLVRAMFHFRNDGIGNGGGWRSNAGR